MFFIHMSFTAWAVTLFVALLLVFLPFIVISNVANSLSEPFKSIVLITGQYILIPVIFSYLYYYKTRKTGQGSALFWVYCGIFFLLSIYTLVNFFTQDLPLKQIVGPVVIGIVSLAMIVFAYKTKKSYSKDVEAYQDNTYDLQREDDIKKHAEAILLAEKMKNHID